MERRRWLDAEAFEHALAATNLLPGPASTQLAIYCAWRLRGARGALLGGCCFVLPAVAIVLALSVAFLASSPPTWVRGAGAGAGAAVAAVAVQAGLRLAPPIWKRAEATGRAHVAAYTAAGAAAVIAAPAWLVLVLVGCGAVELGRRRARARPGGFAAVLPPLAAAPAVGGLGALAWTAFKVGALSFGGGFVIVPLMQSDAVHVYHWMTDDRFLNAVALGQVTPGPVVATVAAVGYAAHGVAGALLAAAVAFAPSFAFVLVGAQRFERLIAHPAARAFFAGAAPAAVGAIVGSAVPLSLALGEAWQVGVLGAAAVALLGLRRGVVPTLLLAGAAGVLAALAGAPLPR